MTQPGSLDPQEEHQPEAPKSNLNRQIKGLQSPTTFWANRLLKSTRVANKMVVGLKLMNTEKIKILICLGAGL